jgi:hypothetical protein
VFNLEVVLEGLLTETEVGGRDFFGGFLITVERDNNVFVFKQ